MKNFISGILILGLLTSCSKFPDPSVEVISSYSFYKNGSNQRAWAGEYLEDSISLQIYSHSGVTTGMRVVFSILAGGGELTSPVTVVDQSGLAYTRWKTGNASTQQITEVSVYDLKGNLLSSSNFIAYAFSPNVWDKIREQPDANMWDLVADTVNNLTFMISDGTLYRQMEMYYNWEAENTTFFNGLSSIEIDSRNFLYVSNYSGDVYISTNKGYSWNKCARPFTGDYNTITLFVSNNNWVWASTADKKLVCSKDEGYSWQDASAGLSAGDGLGEIYRHPDGTLFFRTMKYRLFKSEDDGKNWLPVTLQDDVFELLMTAAGDLLIYSYNGVHRIMKSTDKGENFKDIYLTTSNSWTPHVFHYYKGTYFLLIAGKGIIRTNDLIHFEEYMGDIDLYNLFIDHNGVFIGKSFNSLFYRNNS